MTKSLKQTALLTCAVASLTFGMLSVPAGAAADAPSSDVISLEAVLPQDAADDEEAFLLLAKERFVKGNDWLRQRPTSNPNPRVRPNAPSGGVKPGKPGGGGRGTGGINETSPEEPASPFLP